MKGAGLGALSAPLMEEVVANSCRAKRRRIYLFCCPEQRGGEEVSLAPEVVRRGPTFFAAALR